MSFRNWFKPVSGRWQALSRWQKIFSVVATILIVAAGSVAAYSTFSAKPQGGLEILPPKPKKIASPLTGVRVAPELAKRPVTAIIIENSMDARPQSGLRQAGVVFEAIAEGGITRFVTIYQEDAPSYIGPVRSLRPYFIDWAAPFEASIAHVGGSPQALKQVRSGGFRDIDQFFNAGSYWRQPTRSAPHNMYTSFKKLDALNKAKGYKSSKFDGWLRQNGQPQSTITAQAISFNVSSANFNVRYTYDKKTNSYKRFLGGVPHLSTDSPRGKGKPITPEVVIGLVVGYGIASDGHHSTYKVNGSGSAYIFQGGGVVKATWKKTSVKNQLRFLDQAGNPIKLNAGQTWITVVGDSSRVSYKAAPKPANPQQ